MAYRRSRSRRRSYGNRRRKSYKKRGKASRTYYVSRGGIRL